MPPGTLSATRRRGRIPGLSTWWAKLTGTRAPGAAIWIRLYVGAIFLSEGIQKFLFPDKLGTGRFTKIGIPAPGFFATLDGILEIICGLLIIVGLLTRLAAIPMIVNMVGALTLTKLPILWGHSPLFATERGWWDFAHESRTDLALLCGSVFLLLAGPGPYSLDSYLRARRGQQLPTAATSAGSRLTKRRSPSGTALAGSSVRQPRNGITRVRQGRNSATSNSRGYQQPDRLCPGNGVSHVVSTVLPR